MNYVEYAEEMARKVSSDDDEYYRALAGLLAARVRELEAVPPEAEYTNWLENELMECMRIASRGLYKEAMTEEDAITDSIRLHGIRLMVEADPEGYEDALKRWQSRHPQSPPQRD